jgi:hypothetical protein
MFPLEPLLLMPPVEAIRRVAPLESEKLHVPVMTPVAVMARSPLFITVRPEPEFVMVPARIPVPEARVKSSLALVAPSVSVFPAATYNVRVMVMRLPLTEADSVQFPLTVKARRLMEGTAVIGAL